jgi:hypothetical protein
VAWTARTHTACDENIDLSAFPAAIVVKALAQATSPTHGVAWSLHLGNVQSFSHILVWAERRPALAVMAPLICWSLINSMFKYAVPAIWRSLAAARLRADCPFGNAPTKRVRRGVRSFSITRTSAPLRIRQRPGSARASERQCAAPLSARNCLDAGSPARGSSRSQRPPF